MGSKARNVLMGIAGGMQGFQQAAKLEQEEEELKLKKKFMEQQMEVYKDKLVESGTKRENTTKFRLMLKGKKDRGEKITPEDIAQYLDVDEGAKFILGVLKEEGKEEKLPNLADQLKEIQSLMGSGGAISAPATPQLTTPTPSVGVPQSTPTMPQGQPSAPRGLFGGFTPKFNLKSKSGLGVTLEPNELDKVQSTPGKLLQDRGLFVRQFGEGSPQVKAMDKALTEGGQTIKLTDKDRFMGMFTRQATDFIEVRDAYNKALVAGNNAAGDMALITGYARILEPGARLTNEDVERAGIAGRLEPRVQQFFNMLMTQKRLTTGPSGARPEILGEIKSLFNSQLTSHRQLEDEYRRIAKTRGFDPDEVIPDFIGGRQKSGGKVRELDLTR